MRIGPFGVWEILIILVVVLVIFGPRRLPEMAKGLGQSVREFRKGIKDMKDDFETEVKKDEATPQAVTTQAAPAEAAPVKTEVVTETEASSSSS